MMQGLNKLKDTMRGAKLPPVAGLALLLLVGALVVSAAPRGGNTAAPLRAQALVSTSSPVATQAPHIAATATATKAPTTHANAPQAPTVPTDTPVPPTPTATPVPPTPTATPAPSWHTVGSYSGSAPGAVVTLTHVTGSVRIDWTCAEQADGSKLGVGFTFAPTSGTGGFGVGLECSPGNCTVSSVTSCNGTTMTGVWTYDQAGDGRDWNVSENSTDTWTATVEVYY